jgi:hypothetical protein
MEIWKVLRIWIGVGLEAALKFGSGSIYLESCKQKFDVAGKAFREIKFIFIVFFRKILFFSRNSFCCTFWILSNIMKKKIGTETEKIVWPLYNNMTYIVYKISQNTK